MIPQFELPIPDPIEIEDHTVTNMGLKELYRTIMKPKTCFGEKLIENWTKHCTDNVIFLKDTQKLLTTDLPEITHDCNSIQAICNKIKEGERETNENDEGFHAKYQYMEWEPLKFLNKSCSALQIMSIYNLASPIISLCVPIICLIIPFFVIRLRGITISVTSYIEILQEVLQKHQLGQLFTFSSASWEKRIYIILSAGFYILGIYQNVRSCARFYANMSTIHDELKVVNSHVNACIAYIRQFELCLVKGNCTSYCDMSQILKEVKKALENYRDKLKKISPSVWSNAKIFEIGNVMECFYELYHDNNIYSLLDYTCNLCGYLDNMRGVKESNLGLCRFNGKKDKFYNAYLPGHSVTNTYSMTKHSLITGPNAAGKTTILKATLFNVILSQQFGCGCYSRASLRPYHKIHCYLNIPDTNGRDSLFQAEARRCKMILDSIEHSKCEHRHFCIFDELYSGTNPYEAVGSAVAFLKYMNKYPNVTLMLTTHFIDLCERLDKISGFQNRHMSVCTNDGEFRYLYKIADGISTIKGGVKVLKELEYPEMIVKSAYSIINEQ